MVRDYDGKLRLYGFKERQGVLEMTIETVKDQELESR